MGFAVFSDVTVELDIGETEELALAIGDSVFINTVEVAITLARDENESDCVALDDINEDNEFFGEYDCKTDGVNVGIFDNDEYNECETIGE